VLRVSVPAQSIEFVRDDVASVSTRRVVISREGDEPARDSRQRLQPDRHDRQAGGAAVKRLPAVVLVGGSGRSIATGPSPTFPVYGQLANALADAGFLVCGTTSAGSARVADGLRPRASRVRGGSSSGGQVRRRPEGCRSQADRGGGS
jgi:hypothetical protein